MIDAFLAAWLLAAAATPAVPPQDPARPPAASDVRTRDVYAGPRDTSPLAFREVRDLNFDPFIYMRIRKTWG